MDIYSIEDELKEKKETQLEKVSPNAMLHLGNILYLWKCFLTVCLAFAYARHPSSIIGLVPIYTAVALHALSFQKHERGKHVQAREVKTISIHQYV